MQIKKILLTAFFALSTVSSCKAGIVNLTALTFAVPALYVGTKLYQADGNLDKAQRLIRQDKDATCTHTIDYIEKVCKEMIKLLEQAKSTPLQILEDLIQEHKDDAIKSIKETDAFQNSKKTATDGYNSTKETIDKWAKPKK